VALAAEVDVARSPHVPGASDNATGVAAAMALLAGPPAGVNLVGVFCGCEESGMAGARRAGLTAPQRWQIGGWTDAILARFAGLPTISLLSIGPDGAFTNYHRPTDTTDNVDQASLAACVALARGIVEEVAARGALRVSGR